MLKTIWKGSVAIAIPGWLFGPSERILRYSQDGFSFDELCFLGVAVGFFCLYLIGVFFPFLRDFHND